MPKRSGAVHVTTTRRHCKGKEYETTLLRRSYREGGKVKNETVGNLSHLPAHVIDGIRAMLSGRSLVDLDQDLEICRSLPHGHVAAVLGVLRSLDLERLISRQRCRERDLVVALICQALIGPGCQGRSKGGPVLPVEKWSTLVAAARRVASRPRPNHPLPPKGQRRTRALNAPGPPAPLACRRQGRR